MIKICQCLLVLGILLYDISEGCGRVPATPPPPASSTPAPTPPPSSNETIRGEKCTDKEKNLTRCIYGQGECFVLVIGFERKAACHCTRIYMGKKCELLNVEVLIPSKDPVATASIAASVAGVVIFVVIVIAVLIVYIRRKRRRRRRDKERAKANGGPPLLPENHTVSDTVIDGFQQPRTDMQFNGNGNYFFPEEKKQMIEYKTTRV